MPLWGGGTALFCSFLRKTASSTQPLSLTALLSITQSYSALLSTTQHHTREHNV
ncbi:MAG: hypothetical protein R3Y61_01880 [Rikenellaceae bacterium]